MAMTVSELQVVVSADTSKAESSLSSFGNAIKTGLGIGAGIKLLEGAVSGISNAFEGSIGAASTFESKMSAIKAVSGATAGEMEQLSGLALQLGKDTSFSASEAADGINELIKAGVSVADVMGGGAKGALDLAAAGGISVAEAAEIASNAMNVFKDQGVTAAQAANTIAGAANASAIDVTDFKMSLAASGAVAATVGIGFEDLSTAIAVMGQAGIKGSDAGTSLKTMMLNLSPSTKQATAEMKALGIITADGSNQFFDASGKAKSFSEIAGVLQTATKDLTQEQKLNALQTIFGTDAIRAAAVMAKAGAEGFDEMAESIGKVTAADVAKERLNNLKGSIEQLTGSLETAGISVGLKFTPYLKTAADAATQFVNDATPALEAFADQTIAGVTEAGRQLADSFRTVQQAWSGDWSPSDQIDPLVNSVGEATVAVKAFVDVVTAAVDKAGAMGAWDDVTTGLSNLVDVAGIASDRLNDVSAALDRARGTSEGGASAVDVLAGAIKGAAAGFEYATVLVDDFLDSIGSAIAVAIDFTTGLSRTGAALQALKSGDLPGVVSALSDAQGAFGAGLQAAEDFRQRGLLTTSGEAQAMAAAVGVSMQSVATSTDTAMQGAVSSIQAAGPEMASAASEGASGAVQAVQAQSGAASAAGQSVGDSMGSGMQSGILSWVGSIASAAANLVSSALGAARAEADSHSPSKKTEQLGKDLAEGLEIGLNSSSLGADMQAKIRDFIAASRDYIPVAGQIARVEGEIKTIREQSQTEALFRAQKMIDVDSEALRLKQAQVSLERDLVPLRQSLARADQDIANIERGSLSDRTSLIAMDGKRKDLRLQEIDLEKQLIGLDTGSKKAKAIQEQIDALRDQDRLLSLEGERISLTNQVAATSAKERKEQLADQAAGQQTVIDRIKDQIETLGAEQAVFSANEAVIKNATDNEVAYRQRLIAVFTAEGKPLADRITAGLALVDQLEKEGAISKDLADKLRSVAKEATDGKAPVADLGNAMQASNPQVIAATKEAEKYARAAAEISDNAQDAAHDVLGLAKVFEGQHTNIRSLFDPVPRRAAGGPVSAGVPYIVGEHRPELFVPGESGMILPSVPAPWMGGSAGGGSFDTLELVVKIGDREAERIYVTGQQLSARRSGSS